MDRFYIWQWGRVEIVCDLDSEYKLTVWLLQVVYPLNLNLLISCRWDNVSKSALWAIN